MNKPARNLNIAELVAQDTAHHFHPFTDHKGLHAAGGARMITHASGVHIWDGAGKKYLDAMSGLWCVNIGYGRTELAQIAAEQMQQMAYYPHTAMNLPAAQLGQQLNTLMGGDGGFAIYKQTRETMRPLWRAMVANRAS